MSNSPNNESADALFAAPQSKVAPFSFNQAVVDVFPDMINRSVPGYSDIVSTIPKILRRFIHENAVVYDLGCALGAASLSVARAFPQLALKINAIDYSREMVERCKQNINAYKYASEIEVKQGDISQFEFESCSIVIMNFTLQFISPEKRQDIIAQIYQALKPGGVLILSEKIANTDSTIQDLLVDLHHDFKRDNGYSELEISQKRSALESVMIVDNEPKHKQRLSEAGFAHHAIWYQHFNFASFLAVK
ncbi:carboxy-S-adenosyl-L-methionine synthase CmoA [Agaribacter flavus]|uniref:Carboxy-S-adenosyl-L-methionine synthase n=1 Tax=Agaribacter flavus TaxID=1902781 RepID=A0ABV7FR26_9ALTE